MGRHGPLGDEERGYQTEDVRGRECTPQHPAATMARDAGCPENVILTRESERHRSFRIRDPGGLTVADSGLNRSIDRFLGMLLPTLCVEQSTRLNPSPVSYRPPQG